MLDIVKPENINSMYLKEDNSLNFYPDKSQIVVVNNKPIGFYTTHIVLGKLTLEYNLFKSSRNQKFGSTFVNIVTELVGRENEEYDKIYLLIPPQNKKSLSVALKNNYKLSNDFDFCEKINEEMSGYCVYDRVNEFYRNYCKKMVIE